MLISSFVFPNICLALGFRLIAQTRHEDNRIEIARSPDRTLIALSCHCEIYSLLHVLIKTKKMHVRQICVSAQTIMPGSVSTVNIAIRQQLICDEHQEVDSEWGIYLFIYHAASICQVCLYFWTCTHYVIKAYLSIHNKERPYCSLCGNNGFNAISMTKLYMKHTRLRGRA